MESLTRTKIAREMLGVSSRQHILPKFLKFYTRIKKCIFLLDILLYIKSLANEIQQHGELQVMS